jgi:L-fuconolactonase
MAIDTHVHFWRLADAQPIGVNRRIAGIERDFLPADLRALTGPLGVDRVVLVQAAPAVAETEWLLDLAENDDFIAAVVGWVDLESDVRVQLRRFAGRSKLVGVRAMVADVSTPGWLDSPAVRRGIAAIADAGLAIDLLVRPTQLAECVRLLRAIPGLRANINHCGRPLIVAQEWSPWAENMTAIAACPGIVCKLSGLIERGGFEWRVDDLVPYVKHLLQTFGAGQLMFASNWPIINLVGNYRRWWDAINDALQMAQAVEADRVAIFQGTATRFYRL